MWNNMWNTIFQELIFKPQFNIFVFFYQLTSQNPIATMVLVAVLFNVLAFKWYLNSYLNGQKRLVLTQDIKNIAHYCVEKRRIIGDKLKPLQKDPVKNQAKILELQKSSSQTLGEQQKVTGELNKKFAIVGNYGLKTALLQIWVSIGLFNVFNLISNGGEISGLYPFLWGTDKVTINPQTANFFGLSLGKGLNENGLIWIAFVNALFSFLACYYLFKIAKRPVSRELTRYEEKIKKQSKLQREKDNQPEIDQEKMQAQMQSLNIYMIPLMSLFFNLTAPINTGVNLYYLCLAVLFLVRVMISDWYYKTHLTAYIQDIYDSGPHYEYEENLERLYSNTMDFTSQTELVVPRSKKQKEFKKTSR
jgi:membrane protein insertase Oxa1/YidC/SpoIIIJ